MIGRRTFVLAALLLFTTPLVPAQAGGRVGIVVGRPYYYRPYYGYYRPYVVPSVVFVAPAPVYVVPPPGTVYVQPPTTVYQIPPPRGATGPELIPAPLPAPSSEAAPPPRLVPLPPR